MAANRNYVLLLCLVIVCFAANRPDTSCNESVTCQMSRTSACGFHGSHYWKMGSRFAGVGHTDYYLKFGPNAGSFSDTDLFSPALCNGPVHVNFTAYVIDHGSHPVQLQVFQNCSHVDERSVATVHGTQNTGIQIRKHYSFSLPACSDDNNHAVVFRVVNASRGSEVGLDNIIIHQSVTLPTSTNEQSTAHGITTHTTHVTRPQPVSHNCTHSKSLSCGFEGTQDPACGFHAGHNWILAGIHTGHSILYDTSRGTFHDPDLYSPPLCSGILQVTFSAFAVTSFGQLPTLSVFTNCSSLDQRSVNKVVGVHGSVQHVTWKNYTFFLPACSDSEATLVVFHVSHSGTSSYVGLDDVSIQQVTTTPEVPPTCNESLSCQFEGSHNTACGFRAGHNWRLAFSDSDYHVLYNASKGTFQNPDLFTPSVCSGILQVNFSAFVIYPYGEPTKLSVFTNCTNPDQRFVNNVEGTPGSSLQNITWQHFTFYFPACLESPTSEVVFHVSHAVSGSYVGLDDIAIQQVSAIPTTSTTTSTTTTTTIAPSATPPATDNTTTSAITKPPSVCQKCHNVQCFNGPESVTCTQEQPHCASRVVDSTDGERVVFKGCISQAECEAWVPNLLQRQNCHLVNQHVTGYDLECLFCCHGDLCNGGPGYIPHPDTQIGHSDQLDLIG